MRSGVVLLAGILGFAPAGLAQTVWQADLQIRSLAVSQTEDRLTARVVVVSEFGSARAVRLELLLPVGVGLLEQSPGCEASPGPEGVREPRARVICRLGDLPPRASRVIVVVTTLPPPGVNCVFGVIALSDTPDPRPGNNFAEKAIP
ncbi:MAG: hypothetical protein ABI836_02720 [Gemmatimonadota bacterium]